MKECANVYKTVQKESPVIYKRIYLGMLQN